MRAGVIQRIHDIVDPKLPPGVRAYYNGSLEISETYNRITLDNQRKFTPPILLFTVAGDLPVVPLVAEDAALALFASLVSVLWTLGLYSLMGFSYNVLASMLVPLIVVLAIADDVHIMQHWDEERRHGDASRRSRTRSRTWWRRSSARARRRRSACCRWRRATSSRCVVRHRVGGRHHGRLRDLARADADAAVAGQAGDGAAPHERYLLAPLQARRAVLVARIPARAGVSLVGGGIASLGMTRLRVDTNHINFFSANHPLGSRRGDRRKLAGVYSFQIMLEGPPDSLKTPDALQRIDRLQEELRTLPHVRKVTSVADYVKRINSELNDGRRRPT